MPAPPTVSAMQAVFCVYTYIHTYIQYSYIPTLGTYLQYGKRYHRISTPIQLTMPSTRSPGKLPALSTDMCRLVPSVMRVRVRVRLRVSSSIAMAWTSIQQTFIFSVRGDRNLRQAPGSQDKSRLLPKHLWESAWPLSNTLNSGLQPSSAEGNPSPQPPAQPPRQAPLRCCIHIKCKSLSIRCSQPACRCSLCVYFTVHGWH